MTTTLSFLRALFSDPVGPGLLVVWTVTRRDGNTYGYWVNTLEEAADHAHRVKKTRDVYFFLAQQDSTRALEIVRQRWPKVKLPSVRGSHDSSVALPALWAEVRVAGPGDTPGTLPPDEASVLRLFGAVSVPPPIIVATGDGYQAYWPLHEPWLLDSDQERLRARDLLHRLNGALAAAARCSGWALDVRVDLAAMPRLPGTLNLELPEPKPVSVIHFPLDPRAPEARFSPSDFDHLPPVPELALATRGQGEDDVAFEPMLSGCRFLQFCHQEQDRVAKNMWLEALALAGRSKSKHLDRLGLAHDFSRGHPGYNPVKTEAMLEHALRHLEPGTCDEIEERFDTDGKLCGLCPNRGMVRSPIVLGQPAARRVGVAPLVPQLLPADTIATADTADTADRGDAVDAGEIDLFAHGGGVLHVAVWLDGPGPAVTRARPSGAEIEEGVVDDLVHGLAELLRSFGGSATVREILGQLACANDEFPRLRSALERLCPRLESGELPRSTQFAGHLRRHRGRIVRGACIDQASKSYQGVNWTVRRVA